MKAINREFAKFVTNLLLAVGLLVFLTLYTLPEVAFAQSSTNVSMVAQKEAGINSALWTPKTCPTNCQSINSQLLVVDVSKSMQKNHLIDIAIEQMAQYIDTAPVGTYIIIARFGRTADVVNDKFINNQEDRENLKQSLKSLKATQPVTNLDEAAKLIEWVNLKLKDTFTDLPLSLSVKVLSDEISSPDPDKKKFSLEEYFKKELATGQIHVMEIALSTSNTASVSVPSNQAGYITLTIPVNGLKKLLQETSIPAREPKSQTPPPVQRIVSSSFIQKYWMVLVGSTILLAGGIYLTRRRRDSNLEDSFIDTEPVVPPTESIPTVLTIIERELPKDNTDGDARVLRESKIAIAPSVEVTVGTNPGSAYVTKPLDGNKAERLFCIKPLQNGLAQVKSLTDDLLCNGKTIPAKGVTVALNEPLRIQLQNREWLLKPASTNGNRASADDLFARIRTNRTTEPVKN